MNDKSKVIETGYVNVYAQVVVKCICILIFTKTSIFWLSDFWPIIVTL